MVLSDWLGVVGILVGVVGISLALWIWHSSVDKKLDQIISANNVLTIEQAEAMIKVYLEWTSAELQAAINDFFDNKFDDRAKGKTEGAADEFIYRQAMEIIGDKRAKLQCLILPGKVSLMHFLETYSPVTGQIIAKAREDVLVEIKGAVQRPASKSEARTRSLLILHKASRATFEKLMVDLHNFYGLRSRHAGQILMPPN